jgi:hypothetical protein
MSSNITRVDKPIEYLPPTTLSPSKPIKKVLTEIEISGFDNSGKQRPKAPVVHQQQEQQHKPDNEGIVTSFHSKSVPVAPPSVHHDHEIETGGFPLKLPELYPMESDFCYSQSSESGQSICSFERWMDIIHLPPTCNRQASLGDSLLLPPTGRPNCHPRRVDDTLPPVHHTNREYIAPVTSPLPSFHHRNHVATIHSNTSSCNNATDTTATITSAPTEDEALCLEDSEDGAPSWYFRSDVSAITYGSEFDALLLRMNSLPQLVPATSPVVSSKVGRNNNILHASSSSSSSSLK